METRQDAVTGSLFLFGKADGVDAGPLELNRTELPVDFFRLARATRPRLRGCKQVWPPWGRAEPGDRWAAAV